MKHYYEQLSELRIAEKRLNTLLEKKQKLLTKATSTTGSLKEVVVFGTEITNKPLNYAEQIEEVDIQINEVEEEIKLLKKGLHEMDEILKHISGIEERIFRLYYIENKTPTQISYIVPCGIATVYRYIKKINKKTQVDKK